MHVRRYQNWGRNDLVGGMTLGGNVLGGEIVLGAKRLGVDGETTKGENRGETNWGGNVLGGETTCYRQFYEYSCSSKWHPDTFVNTVSVNAKWMITDDIYNFFVVIF